MLKKKSLLHHKKGQAMIEFLPAILLFIVILIVSVVFFIGLRESTLLQEAARNAAFAKIANSGPLVSRNKSLDPGATSQKYYSFPLTGAKNVEVDNTNFCFVATPQPTSEGFVKLPSIFDVDMNLKRTHKMTVFRLPASLDACQ